MNIHRETSSHWMIDFQNQLMRGRHLILHGNIADQFLVNGIYNSLPQYLEWYFREEGYEVIAQYDIVDGFRLTAPSEMQTPFLRAIASTIQGNEKGASTCTGVPDQAGTFAPSSSQTGSKTNIPEPGNVGQRGSIGTNSQQTTPHVTNMPRLQTPEEVLPVIRNALRQTQIPVAMIVEFADKIFTDPDHQADAERELVVQLKKITQEAGFIKSSPQEKRNVLVIVAGKLGSIPSWLYQDNPFITVLYLPRPRKEERRCFISNFCGNFFGGDTLSAEQKQKVVEIFPDITDGLTSWDLEMIRRTSITQPISIQQTKKLVDYYIIGRIDDPWKDLDVAKIREAQPRLETRVLGQSHAIEAVTNMLACARGGISTTRTNGRGGQPKGVLWFCGPTGVGKTELAKALTELVFGDESAFAKFDMSEYKESNTIQRLTGAPPSYVGYDQGGQLTSRCQERPFSLFLFDEIEKAHHSVLDIFLQILDDGRLTDSKGQTAFFSKACIVFTSNIGGSTWNVSGTSEEELPAYEEGRDHYLAAVRKHFMHDIQRPELLNRLGDNIIVFDILRPQFFPGICSIILENIVASAREQYGFELDFSDGEVIKMICNMMLQVENFKMGGRRIHELIKTHVKTPLNRLIPFLNKPKSNKLNISAAQNNSHVLVDGKPVP